MNRLRVCSGRDAKHAFGQLGYEVDEQAGGDAIFSDGKRRRLTIPDHKELARGTLRS